VKFTIVHFNFSRMKFYRVKQSNKLSNIILFLGWARMYFFNSANNVMGIHLMLRTGVPTIPYENLNPHPYLALCVAKVCLLKYADFFFTWRHLKIKLLIFLFYNRFNTFIAFFVREKYTLIPDCSNYAQ